jgi:hypothetical protein
MPFLLPTENGIAGSLKEQLWAYVSGRLSEELLADFIAAKLDLADDNLYRLEEEIEYPDCLADLHLLLHSAFSLYQNALLNLEEFLWGEEQEDEQLPAIMRDLVQADRITGNFTNDLSERVDPDFTLDWVS